MPMYYLFDCLIGESISQEGRQGMLFIVSNSLSGTVSIYLTRPVNEDTYTSQHASRGSVAWVSSNIPFPNTHLTLKLVCMEGPVQIHGFCSWGHFASDAVHIVIVVDSLGVER